MEKTLFDEFLSEDADKHARILLLEAIRLVRTEEFTGSKDFTFNRFNVKLDANSQTVVIEDDLNPAEEGMHSCSIDEFENRLRMEN